MNNFHPHLSDLLRLIRDLFQCQLRVELKLLACRSCLFAILEIIGNLWLCLPLQRWLGDWFACEMSIANLFISFDQPPCYCSNIKAKVPIGFWLYYSADSLVIRQNFLRANSPVAPRVLWIPFDFVGMYQIQGGPLAAMQFYGSGVWELWVGKVSLYFPRIQKRRIPT